MDRENYQADWWNEQLGVQRNQDFSSDAGPPAIDTVFTYAWYRIYIEKNDLPDLSFADFASQFEAGDIALIVVIGGQEVAVTSHLPRQIRISPNNAVSHAVLTRISADSQGAILVDQMGYAYRTWFLAGELGLTIPYWSFANFAKPVRTPGI